ncbi:MAG: lipopolysaccharide transport periplasmic protein LptA [Desulfobulbaceae bacterium]|nr:lipopolysaccharide transport periplasmic protein LptA [Desulfobulbaceae bacterium]
MPRILPPILAMLCLTLAFAAQAAPPAKDQGSEAPISIEADHMTSFEKSNSVLFTGAVDARQANVRIRTDKMTVYYTPDDKGKKSDKTAAAAGDSQKKKVEKMHCVGNVQISRDDWFGKSREMIYLAQERRVRLIGDAKAWQGQDMVSGDEIIHYIDEERSEVIAGPGERQPGGKTGRVKMTILQK